MAKNKYIFIVVIFILSFLSYSNTFNYDFVWDDTEIARENPDIRYIKNIPKLLISPYGHPSQFSRNILYYRPAIMISYVIDYKIWGVDGGGFHITNIFLHSLTAILLFFFLNKFSEDLFLSFLASIFFSIHPIHTQSVAWISGRTDILCALFYLLSLLFGIEYIRQKKNHKLSFLIYSVFFFFIALLAKEMAITMPLILLVFDYLHNKKISGTFSLKDNIIKYFSYLPAGVLYLFLRWYALSGKIYNNSSETIFNRIPKTIETFADYIRLLLFPFNLNTLYPSESIKFEISDIAILILFTLVIFNLLIMNDRKVNNNICFGIAWLTITLFPVSNIIPFSPITKSEHFLYIPSIGFSLIIAAIGIKIYEFSERRHWKAIKALLFFLSLIAFFSFLSHTLNRNRIWKDELTLFKNQVIRNPQFPRAHFNLALAYKTAGNMEKAISELEMTLQMDPNFSYSYINLGNIYFDKGNIEKAIEYYQKAIKLEDTNAYLLNNLGVAYGLKGRGEDAEKLFYQALKLNPQFVSPHINLGNLYAGSGKFEEALKHLNKALEIDPRSTNKGRIIRAVVFLNLGKLKEAENDLINADNSVPNKFSVLVMLGDIYKEKGRFADALRIYKKAYEINPTDQSLNEKIKELQKG